MGHEVRDKNDLITLGHLPIGYLPTGQNNDKYTTEAHSPREVAKRCSDLLAYLPTAQTERRF